MRYTAYRASESISFSSSSMSIGSGLAGLVSGWGSISPGRRRLKTEKTWETRDKTIKNNEKISGNIEKEIQERTRSYRNIKGKQRGKRAITKEDEGFNNGGQPSEKNGKIPDLGGT